MNEQPEALRLADALTPPKYPDWVTHIPSPWHPPSQEVRKAAAELQRLHKENERLRTVMVAAAEEISAHWEAHCDADGYGPANLMRRLERGIASEYGYTAGAFGRLSKLNQKLLEALEGLVAYVDERAGDNECRPLENARALIAKAEAA